jgi:hypothetical protein
MGNNGRDKMKFINLGLLGLILCLILASCGPSIPENYGVYGYYENKSVPFKSQRILFKGNLMQSIPGLCCPSGTELEKVDYLIVFIEGIDPDLIQLSMLNFKRNEYVANVFGRTSVELNMWVEYESIPFEIAPISARTYMYRLNLKSKLTEGFYAIHFGYLNNSSTIVASKESVAYDFVIGQLENYPSYEILKKQNEEMLKDHAIKLIDKFNNLYNTNSFIEISSIYRQGGITFEGNALDKYVKDSEIWFKVAGKVIEYTIIDEDISEFHGFILVNTEYEKIGRRTERITVSKIKEDYIITEVSDF